MACSAGQPPPRAYTPVHRAGVARMGDPMTHGRSIVMGVPQIIVNGKPAATLGDFHVCPMVAPGPAPHIGGPIISAGLSTDDEEEEPARPKKSNKRGKAK